VPLVFALCADETEEARRVRRHLEAQRRRGRLLAECAVLYRTNAQSRALETELRHAGMPYEIVGGVSFYQRREVKDLLAHLRLVVNPTDAASFWRIWNTPRRGLGPAVQAMVEARMAAGFGEPLEALRQLAREGALRGAARAGADSLLALFDTLRAHREESVERLFGLLLEKSGYLAHLEASNEQGFEERRSNVEELGVSAAQFGASGRGGLLEYLSECSLLTDADRLSEDADRVLLLTAHNAKGLEFHSVVIAGLEEGLMPHASSLEDPAELEEERRLFYVALTRAKDDVLLTAAAYRRRFDGAWGAPLSRFLEEIPETLLDREDTAMREGRHAASRPASRGRGPVHSAGWGGRRDPDAVDWDDARSGDGPDETIAEGAGRERPSHGVTAAPVRGAAARRAIGQRVRHETFGLGTVLDADGEGPDMKLTVRFTGAIKKVLARFVSGGADVD